MKAYNHLKVEKKWQGIWEKKKIFQAENGSKKPKFYGLIEFPYPSGSGLHVGHIRSNTAMDIISRKRRMEGYNVLYPIGWDAFGLPTENYAIKTGVHPIKVTKDNTNTFRRQLKALGFSFDWSREVNTTDPKYYKWTQWIFLQFFKQGLAYKKKTEINWCPSCKIGLANEEVVGGMCERCGGQTEKREKEQWMLAITKYADRLDKDLDLVDYLPKIKIQQRNWIGRSEGAEIEFEINIAKQKQKNSPALPASGLRHGSNFSVSASQSIKVFTTRPDTIFGATYVVLAPEHGLVEKLKSQIENWSEVEDYIKKAKKETEIERTAEDKIKTGVELKGVKAINPANKEEVPIWIADYVLPHYGTGAIMAVPAHDLRDFEFAKKYNLPIKQVVSHIVHNIEGSYAIREGVEWKDRDAVMCIVKHWEKNEYLCQEWKDFSDIRTFVSGGIEPGEDIVVTGKREIKEEAGYLNAKFIRQLDGFSYIEFYHQRKQVNTRARFRYLYYELENGQKEKISEEEDNQAAIVWKRPEEVLDFLTISEKERIWEIFNGKEEVFTGSGYMVNSGQFDGMDSEKAKKEIVKFVGGKEKITFKLRDWVFSRQRYWGEPIPLIHCPACAKATAGKENSGWVPVPEKDLPVVLPKVAKYKPTDTGESPLSDVKSWVNVKCPKCGGKARRETDTMPNWAGSSWYFLRYVDPKNNKEFASKKNLKYWIPIDWYNGGMEHTTLHLLYSRFWHKFLYDLKLVPTSEPYLKRTSHGMVLAERGEKMSKSKGNVVNPDNLVKIYGADTVRMYEMFMGPFDQAVSWSTDSLIGPRRFLERVWKIASQIQRNSARFTRQNPPGSDATQNFAVSAPLRKSLHKTIKKVSEDIEEMRFNTAVSALMVLVNEMESAFAQGSGVTKEDFKKFLQILSPFAPHLAEELWSMLYPYPASPYSRGRRKEGVKSINFSAWPKWDPNLIKDEEVKIAVQVNGKVRAEIMVGVEESEEEVKKKALAHPAVLRHIDGKEVKKVIYVKNRLINIVF